MKTKAIILIGAVAVATLSFTFTSGKKNDKKYSPSVEANSTESAPAGGFSAESMVK